MECEGTQGGRGGCEGVSGSMWSVRVRKVWRGGCEGVSGSMWSVRVRKVWRVGVRV